VRHDGHPAGEFVVGFPIHISELPRKA
jgi:hypothetical protein